MFKLLIKIILPLLVILFSSSQVIANIDQLPINDILITTKYGDVKQGTRCAAQDTADLSIPRVPKNFLQWRLNNPKQDKDLIIPVAFHIILSATGRGEVTKESINKQIDVLNKAYKSSKIQFTIRSIDRTHNSLYYNLSPGIREFFMKLQLNVDPKNTLNVYTLEPDAGILGWASFPWMYDESSFLHGVVILNQSFPGGNTTSYSSGNTLVHEAGHYLGLYHTFQGGCLAPGDYVDDTPYEAEASYDCPIDKDSCSAAGGDPIHNYMNYTDDECMDHFTADQSNRIDWAVTEYKPGLVKY